MSNKLNVIVADNGTKIFPIQTEDEILGAFFNKTIANYGLTGGGKTYVNNDIVNALASVIPKGIFYSATEQSNGNYGKLSSKVAVFDKFNLDKFKQDVEFQKDLCSVWKKANDDLENLEDMSSRLITNFKLHELKTIISNIDKLDQSNEENKVKAREAKINVYIHYIKQNCKNLSELSVEDSIMIKSMNTNPCMLIVIDDFAAEVAECSKSKNKGKEFFKSLAFNARHFYLTNIFILQDVDAMETKMRRNTHTCIFASPTEARAYFKNGSNGFSRELQSDANHVINKLEKLGGYRTLVYCRDNTYDHMWNYMIGNPSTNPTFGSTPLRELYDKIENKKNVDITSTSNSFVNAMM